MDVESLTHSGEDERGLEHLTQRLRDESARLAARYPPGHVSVREMAKGASRRRRRRFAVGAAAAVLFVAGGALTWSALNQPAGKRLSNQPASIVLAAPGEVRKPQDPSPLADDAQPAHAMLVWRFVITSPDEQGGRRVVATGVYIPERRKEVKFDELSRAEQYAVLRALGSDKKPQWQL